MKDITVALGVSFNFVRRVKILDEETGSFVKRARGGGKRAKRTLDLFQNVKTHVQEVLVKGDVAPLQPELEPLGLQHLGACQ